MAPWFEQVTGLDADSDMLAEAERQATEAGIGNVGWRQLRAEELPAGLGRYRVISFAQSFHWMDQAAVAGTALRMLQPGGLACMCTPPRTAASRLTRYFHIPGRPVRPSRSCLSAISAPPGGGPRACRPTRAIGRKKCGRLPAAIACSGSRSRVRSSSAPVTRSWLRSSLFRARHLACLPNAVTRLKLIFDACCRMPARLDSSASRCVRLPQTFGDQGKRDLAAERSDECLTIENVAYLQSVLYA